jgi:hypothetical protein
LDEDDTDPRFEPGAGPEPDAEAASGDTVGAIVEVAALGFP